MGTPPLHVAKRGRKFCYRCQTTRPVKQFYRYAKYKVCPYSATCKPCQRTDRKKRYQQSDKQKHWEKCFAYKLMANYGITVTDYFARLKDQGGRCAICKAPPTEGRRLAVDHCHASGKVRGLLCMACNRGIGVFKDNPQFLAAAIAYLGSTTLEDAISEIPMPPTTTGT